MSILLAEKWADQAGRQLAARGGRDLEWYFAEEEAAAEAELIVATDLAFGRKMKVIRGSLHSLLCPQRRSSSSICPMAAC
jgi:hypothetical protein